MQRGGGGEGMGGVGGGMWTHSASMPTCCWLFVHPVGVMAINDIGLSFADGPNTMLGTSAPGI